MIVLCQHYPGNQKPPHPLVKIAFYAPLKSPHHARPSGDRRIAQLFIHALELAGYEVELAAELRAWEGRGDSHRQAEIKTRGLQAAEELIARYRKQPADRPHCWFTYHLYHKAPDWIGPAVSEALDIPYVVAEASVARKQQHGRWSEGYAQACEAVRRARLIFTLNSNDLAGLHPLARPESIVSLKPFTDIPAPGDEVKSRLRHDLAARWRVDSDQYWLLCVAMMRNDSKLESYRILADTTARMERRDWQLLVVGDGPAKPAVTDLFRHNPPRRVHFLGRLDPDFIHQLMRASDLFVWPAHNEAFGMAVLEALGCGLPVVAGHSGGIGDIVAHKVTGMLVEHPDGRAMAAAVEKLLADPATLERMSAASLAAFNRHHRLDHAAQVIGAALSGLNDVV